jgi:hypothetical protein
VAEIGGEGKATGAGSGPRDVFISYASHDAAVANTVVEELERHGLACWIAPREVMPGTFYGDEIVHAIDATKALVVILSSQAAGSPHVLREVERAASKRHPVIALRIDQSGLPAGLEYFLNTSQWLDATGADTVRAIPKLVAAIRLAMEKTPTSETANSSTPVAAVAIELSSTARRGWSSRRSAVAIGVTLMAGITAIALYWPGHREHQGASRVAPTVGAATSSSESAAPAISKKSVAVLPFENLSGHPEDAYLADGLQEEILNALARLRDLKVISRTSVLEFRDNRPNVREIGQRLGVGSILEGSIHRKR